ncbi:MAG: hypothetical protein ACFNNL_07900, partial [Kingella oralis]
MARQRLIVSTYPNKPRGRAKHPQNDNPANVNTLPPSPRQPETGNMVLASQIRFAMQVASSKEPRHANPFRRPNRPCPR